MIQVTIWNEFRHEKEDEEVRAIYPDGIHMQLASFLKEDYVVRTATLDEPEHGLPQHVLDETDCLIWWGHRAHDEVSDEVVERVKQRVLNGMGLIVLHSAHFSKPFKALMGTSCDLKWREASEECRLWVVDPTHPILAGIGETIELDQEEMYGEHFDIPTPDELLLINWFEGGEVFRGGCTFKRGKGKIFYFQPGHETYPTYYHPDIQRVISNAVSWCANMNNTPVPKYGHHEAIENIVEKRN